MSAGATIAGGFMQRKAAQAQALGAKIERDTALLRGTQIQERSREDLATLLGNIDAIRSSRNVSLDSETGEAIRSRTVQDAYRDEAVARLAELTRAGAAEQARRGANTQARWAIPIAVLQSGGQIASSASYAKGAR